MALLPTEDNLTNSNTTNAQQKVNFANLRNFIADLLGVDSSDKEAARAALGAVGETDEIGTAQIADSAVTTPKIAGGAVTASKIDINGTTTDTAPAVNDDYVMTFDASSSTNKKVKLKNLSFGPAFSASRTTTQTIVNNNATLVQFSNEIFDTNSCFDSTTDYRFTPTVEGYYQINANVTFLTGAAGQLYSVSVRKNGVSINSFVGRFQGANEAGGACQVAVYLNGSSDFVDVAVYQNSGSSQNISGAVGQNGFSGFLARGI